MTRKEELDYIAGQLTPVVFELLKQYGIGVGEMELAVTLDGVSSLPALMRIGGVDKIVEVPLELLTAKADEAKERLDAMLEQGEQAVQECMSAAAGAKAATEEMLELQGKILESIRMASEAAAAADESRAAADAAESEREEEEHARRSAETERVQAESLRTLEESGREAAEQARETAEAERAVSEQERKDSENAREAAEQAREETIREARETVDSVNRTLDRMHAFMYVIDGGNSYDAVSGGVEIDCGTSSSLN